MLVQKEEGLERGMPNGLLPSTKGWFLMSENPRAAALAADRDRDLHPPQSFWIER